MPGQVTRLFRIFFSLFSLYLVGVHGTLAQDTTSLPQAQVGKPYSISIAVDTENGKGQFTWKLAKGDLPPGLQVSGAGKIEGTPTETRSDPYVFDLNVSDSSQPPQSATLHFSMAILSAPLRIKVVSVASTQLNVQTVKVVDAAEGAFAPADPSAAAHGTPASVVPASGGVTPQGAAGGGGGVGALGSSMTTILPPAVALAPPDAPAGVLPAVVPPTNSADDTCSDDTSDCRDDFVASAYLGLAIDTFASGETRLYLNPNAPNGPKERMVGGIDFGYRLMGTPKSTEEIWPNQLWIYGETVHGVRSSDVDCSKNATFLTCQNALAIPNRPGDQILFTIRNATSLEGFSGLRYEFLTLHPGSISPANLYAKAQAGFLTVAGAPSAAKAIHHVGLGAIATKGDFEGSYLEVGYGRNDLFAQHRLSRWKADAYLSRRITKGISFFAQINVDTDIGPGADSIQSYVGFDFDLRKFTDWFSAK